jgi:hypothetical protein
MEWHEEEEVAPDTLKDFLDKSCYLRFATQVSGLFLTYHRDGGAALYFGNEKYTWARRVGSAMTPTQQPGDMLLGQGLSSVLGHVSRGEEEPTGGPHSRHHTPSR